MLTPFRVHIRRNWEELLTKFKSTKAKQTH